MLPKEPHPHDQLFKQSLGRKEVVLDFLENRLPREVFKQIDRESLQLTNKTFAGKVHVRGESDVIFQATVKNQPGYVYFLIEHESKIDYCMPLRFLEYNVQLMRQHIRDDGHKRLPVVLDLLRKYKKITDSKNRGVFTPLPRRSLIRGAYMKPYFTVFVKMHQVNPLFSKNDLRNRSN